MPDCMGWYMLLRFGGQHVIPFQLFGFRSNFFASIDYLLLTFCCLLLISFSSSADFLPGISGDVQLPLPTSLVRFLKGM
jgi:hypothetical protein